MEEEKQQFKDKSGDKKYFTTIPNLIVNGCSAVESGVYLYIKRKAGENGSFFEAASKTAKALNISKPTYLKLRKSLENKGKIKFAGWIEGKTHPIKVFEVVDIWRENVGTYQKKGKNKNLSSLEKGKKENLRKVKNTTTNNNPLEEEHKEPIIKDFKNLKRLNDLKLKTPIKSL